MTDAILIVGGGIAGLTAAGQCSAAGAKAIIVERGPVIGGRTAAAQMPKMQALDDDPNVEILTLAELKTLVGTPGNFDVSISQRARFVTDACTRCNKCKPVCPEILPNEFQSGLSYRKAIFAPHVETVPHPFVIDIDACLNKPPNYLPCNHCTEVCDDDAIHFDMPLEQTHERKVAAVVIAAGLSEAQPPESGPYGEHPDIVTASEMECLLTAPGPTGGFAAKPSDEDYPASVFLVLNDLGEFAVSTTASQVARLVDQNIDRVTLLVTEKPDAAAKTALGEALPDGIDTQFGLLQSVVVDDEPGIQITYADFETNDVPEERYDIFVLGVEAGAPDGIADLSERLGVELGADGFIDADRIGATARSGVYVAGSAGGPAALDRTLEQTNTAVSAALSNIDPRLLRPDAGAAATDEVPPPTETELRDRIERALFAMLDRGD